MGSTHMIASFPSHFRKDFDLFFGEGLNSNS